MSTFFPPAVDASRRWMDPDDGLFDVLQRMTTEDVNQLLVVDDGKFLGMVARDNVLAFIQARAELGV